MTAERIRPHDPLLLINPTFLILLSCAQRLADAQESEDVEREPQEFEEKEEAKQTTTNNLAAAGGATAGALGAIVMHQNVFEGAIIGGATGAAMAAAMYGAGQAIKGIREGLKSDFEKQWERYQPLRRAYEKARSSLTTDKKPSLYNVKKPYEGNTSLPGEAEAYLTAEAERVLFNERVQERLWPEIGETQLIKRDRYFYYHEKGPIDPDGGGFIAGKFDPNYNSITLYKNAFWGENSMIVEFRYVLIHEWMHMVFPELTNKAIENMTLQYYDKLYPE